MSRSRFGALLVAATVILFCLFSAVATWLIYRGRWPELPPGFLRDVDLWAGLLFLAALVLCLLLPQRRRHA